jgi:hypothetical protein
MNSQKEEAGATRPPHSKTAIPPHTVAIRWRSLHHWRTKRLRAVQGSDVYAALHPNAQRIVAHCIRKYESPDEGITASQSRIASELGLSRKAVNEHLRRIVAVGIFASEMRFRHGRWVSRSWPKTRQPHVNSAVRPTNVHRTTNRYRTFWRWLKAGPKRSYSSRVPFWADNMTKPSVPWVKTLVEHIEALFRGPPDGRSLGEVCAGCGA